MNAQSHLYTQFDKDPAPVVDFLNWISQVYELPAVPRILDVGCGPGRMLSALAAQGWKVHGLEPDADFYNSAIQVAQEHTHIQVERGGFSELDSVRAYDVVAAINNPFAYLLSVDERVDALTRIYRALRPGGVMFLELTNFLYKLWEYEDCTTEVNIIDGKKVIHNMHHEVDFFHGRWVHHDEYIIEGQPNPIRKTHVLAIFPLPEVLYFLNRIGFRDVRTFASYQSRSHETPNGKTILITARKPLMLHEELEKPLPRKAHAGTRIRR